MVFSSHIFLFLFLPVVLLAYYSTPKRWKSATLTAAGFVFYGWWRPDFVLLMMFTAIVDYWAGERISKARDEGRKGTAWLLVSVISNLGLLAYFKYANFAVESWNSVIGTFGGEPMAWTEVILPVGISFYTFKTMSYTIDVYWGHVRKADRFIDYLCFVTMFPELVAGPIIRYITVEDQLRNRVHSAEKFYQGIVALQTGLIKKLLIADVVAQVADAAFAAPSLSPLEAWTGVIAYAFQIYFDFSGYTDMAIGLGLMFGFRFPLNFNQPYRAISITDFWRRWHISLSTWLRDYLYVPLGGNRRSEARTYINLMLTMLLGGLWHGAAWTFIAWGAYQGIWLIAERYAGKRALWASVPRPLQMAATFIVVLGGWVFFRAANLEAAWKYFGAMFAFADWNSGAAAIDVRPLHLLALAAGAIALWGFPTTQSLVRKLQPLFVIAVQPAFFFAVLHVFYEQNVPFLYFQF